MKRRILALFLAAVMCISVIPSMALAANKTSESEPVYLGTEAEFATTFDSMFDENGLRRVAVGYNSNEGELYNKFGLIDKYGKFVVQPIYDKIVTEAEYFLGMSHTSVRPSYFIGGYAQVVRDGMMGLINTKGEEVVPCKYEYVGLPSEGICRVYTVRVNEGPTNTNFFLGYWSLEKNKEILAPNKYYTTYLHTFMSDNVTGEFRRKPEGDYLCVHDFIEGYALVTIGEGEETLTKCTVIDKNGKDIYGKTYEACIDNNFLYYPQKGLYLAFVNSNVTPEKYEKTDVYKAWKNQENIKRGEVMLSASNFTGLVGPKGVVIPAVYTSGHYTDSADLDGDELYETALLKFNYASFQILPDKKLIITSNSINPVLDEYASAVVNRYGVVDMTGKTRIPFQSGGMAYYDYENQIFVTNGKIYNTAGKVISKRTYDMSPFFYNGYSLAEANTGKYDKKNNSYANTWYAVKPDGTEYNLSKALGLTKYQGLIKYSKFNTRGYIWIQDRKNKWGLINFKGEKVLPFVYDDVSYENWHKGSKGYAVVTKKGKSGVVNNKGEESVACIYDGFSDESRFADTAYDQELTSVLTVERGGRHGLVDIASGKVIIPVKYDSVRAFAAYQQQNLNYFEMGAYYAELGDSRLLLDKDGIEVFSTTKNFSEATNGLYRYSDNSGYFDGRGRLIFPGELERSANLEVGNSYTIYIKDKKVYRASANYLEIDYAFKPYKSNSDLSDKEIKAYAQIQKEAHAKAYEKASGKVDLTKVTTSGTIITDEVPADGIYYIRSVIDADYYIEVSSADKNAGGKLIINKLQNSDNQKFKLTKVGRNKYTITAVHSGINWTSGTKKGKQLTQETITNKENQIFTIIKDSDSTYQIIDSIGFYTSVFSGKMEVGTGVGLWTDSPGQDQSFILEKIQ